MSKETIYRYIDPVGRQHCSQRLRPGATASPQTQIQTQIVEVTSTPGPVGRPRYRQDLSRSPVLGQPSRSRSTASGSTITRS